MGLEDLQKKQQSIANDAKKMLEEKDPKVLLEMAEKMKEKCDGLLNMAKSIAGQFPQEREIGPQTVVKLTPDQRERLVEGTGVGMETVTLKDTEKKLWSRQMTKVTAREIEAEATKEAARLRLISDTKAQVGKIIKELKKVDVPELAETIAELERDPSLGLSGKK
jgi:hypothetical protein